MMTKVQHVANCVPDEASGWTTTDSKQLTGKRIIIMPEQATTTEAQPSRYEQMVGCASSPCPEADRVQVCIRC